MRTNQYFDDQTKIPRKWWLLLSTLIALLALIIFLPVYYTLIKSRNRGYLSLAGPHDVLANWTPQCDQKISEELFDYYPDNLDVNIEQCKSRGCCWRQEIKEIKCYYPSNYGYAVLDKGTTFYNGFELILVRLPSPMKYGDDLRNIRMRVEFQTPYRLRIKFYDSQNDRYEVEEPKIYEDYSSHGLRLYSVTYNLSSVPFGIKVRRVATDIILFDTTVTGFTFSNQFLQLTIKLPSRYLYGLDKQSLRDYRRFGKRILRTVYNSKDHPSAHPMYMCLENDGNAHGVLLLNSYAMEIELHSIPAITFRTIGGILDFYIFLGPTPENVVQQYTKAVGRPAMPPYWSLGFQMGRDGYLSADHVKWVLERIKEKNIPQDVQSIHTDYTTGCPFSIKRQFGNLSSLSTDLHKVGVKLIITVRPSICIKKNYFSYPYESGMKMKLFINDSRSNRPLTGKIDRSEVVYPDFENPIIFDWWKANLKKLLSVFEFDGIWLEGNEPYNSVNGSTDGCVDDTFNRPPFIPKITRKNLYDQTLCMDSTHWGSGKHHYDVHNTYAHKMGTVSYRVLNSLKGDRPLILSESTFVGSGKFGGHWFRDKNSLWADMMSSIASILHYSLFGMPYTGSAICGHHGEPEEELCLRWIQLGAFYPLARHHKAVGYKMWITNCNSDEKNRGNFKKEFARVVQRVIEKRYELLPYLYTLFYFAHIEGSTVARPLWHQFSKDNITYNIEEQFLWGSALLISPALKKKTNTVKAYFPKGLWYDYYTGERLHSDGQWEILSALLYNTAKPINLHIFGGHIITTQKSSLNTELSRRNPLKILVALNESQKAEGVLFWDDGKSNLQGEYIFVKFTASNDKLLVKGHSGSKTFRSNFNQVYIEKICIMGLPWQPDYVKINNNYLLKKKQYIWTDYSQTLNLQNILISLTQTTIIHWFD